MLKKIADKKISEAFGYKKYNRYYRLRNGYNNYLMTNQRKMDNDFKIKRTLDDTQLRRELDEIEAKRKKMRHERQIILQELQNQKWIH